MTICKARGNGPNCGRGVLDGTLGKLPSWKELSSIEQAAQDRGWGTITGGNEKMSRCGTLGTWFSSGLGSAGLVLGLGDLKGLSQLKQFLSAALPVGNSQLADEAKRVWKFSLWALWKMDWRESKREALDLWWEISAWVLKPGLLCVHWKPVCYIRVHTACFFCWSSL